VQCNVCVSIDEEVRLHFPVAVEYLRNPHHVLPVNLIR
jgi:hypothetical protein